MTTGGPYVPEPLTRSRGDRARAAFAAARRAGESGFNRRRGTNENPLYPRLLRLKNVHPNSWQRALLVEGMVLLGALAALADKATAWAPLALPGAAAAVVKFHDVLAGVLPPPRERDSD